MAADYAKTSLRLSDVQDKAFMSRSMGCTAVGFSFVRYKPGEGATYMHRHEVQEEVFISLQGTGTLILDDERIAMPEGTMVRVGPTVYRAHTSDVPRLCYCSARHSGGPAWKQDDGSWWQAQC